MNSIFQYLKSKYPKSFWLMCFTITWERFSYHGIATILVLYFTTAISKGGMGLSIIEATSLYVSDSSSAAAAIGPGAL